MKKKYIPFLFMLFAFFFSVDAVAQFIVAKDTVKGRIDFCPRVGDFNNGKKVANDSVFYLYPANSEIDPWRSVDFYTSSRNTERGFILGTVLMRVEDYDIIEVERLSSHGTISFRNDDVKINISVAAIQPNDPSIKQTPGGSYTVHGKQVKGVVRGVAPELRYSSFSVDIKGKVIHFPKRVFEHLLEPEIDNMVVHYNPEKAIVYIIANNGGLDAYYSVLWVVTQNGVSSPYVYDPKTKK